MTVMPLRTHLISPLLAYSLNFHCCFS